MEELIIELEKKYGEIWGEDIPDDFSIKKWDIFIEGYQAGIEKSIQIIKENKYLFKNINTEKIRALEYFNGKYLEEGDNITITYDFLENLENLIKD